MDTLTQEHEARRGTLDDDVRKRIEVALGALRSDPPIGVRRTAESTEVRQELVSIMLADNREAARAGLGRALAHHGFAVSGEARDAAEAVEVALARQPQICLLEADLPGDTIEAIEEIHDELPLTKLAVLTSSRAEGDVTRALRAGANGYVLKTLAPDRIAVALRALLRDEIVLPRALTSALVAELRKTDGVAARRLVARETQFVPGIARALRRRR